MVWVTAINKLTSPWINWLFYTIFERTYLIKGSSSIASTENLPISPPYKINKWKTFNLCLLPGPHLDFTWKEKTENIENHVLNNLLLTLDLLVNVRGTAIFFLNTRHKNHSCNSTNFIFVLRCEEIFAFNSIHAKILKDSNYFKNMILKVSEIDKIIQTIQQPTDV